jgi:hypothetical protein
MQFRFDGAAQIRVPALTLPHAQWGGEGEPIRVVQGTPAPGAVIVPLSDELVRRSDSETIMRQTLIENSATMCSILRCSRMPPRRRAFAPPTSWCVLADARVQRISITI